jgi:hypothetical protein
MNLDELKQKLIVAARTKPLDDRVPLAFEKRVMACLAARPMLDEWALWSRALWRAAAPCVAIMLFFTAWTFFAPNTSTTSNDLAQDFENTLLAAVDQEQPADSAW